MLLTKSQACAHHDIIKHNQGLIYLRAVASCVLLAGKQRTEKVRRSSRLPQHKIYVDENTDHSFANDIGNVSGTHGPTVGSDTFPPFHRVVSKMEKLLTASLA